ncbi:MAG: tyrosine-type recombinase/integrase [Acidobacteriia bacterium]|nr:tyrosine-type recombinase/integrase [Terriglobia bacterium]
MTESTAVAPVLSTAALPVPAILAEAGGHARERFFEFFAAQIRNRNTRGAYLQAAHQFFAWCGEHRLALLEIRPLHVAAYIESKQRELSPPSIKQHLAGLRMLFNWFVVGQVLPANPALFVKGPKFSRQVGITPILEPEQMRDLLDSIETGSLKGLRDRAAIALMAYTFARVTAVILLRREDYRLQGKRAQLRLHEKGGKEKLVWLHHEAEEYLDRYLEKAAIADPKAPLFQSMDKLHRLTGQGIGRRDLLRAVKQRCAQAGLPATICNHTFRGTGITVFLQNGGSLEAAQDMANHADPRTTKLYDRRKDLATLSEIERRIAF